MRRLYVRFACAGLCRTLLHTCAWKQNLAISRLRPVILAACTILRWGATRVFEIMTGRARTYYCMRRGTLPTRLLRAGFLLYAKEVVTFECAGSNNCENIWIEAGMLPMSTTQYPSSELGIFVTGLGSLAFFSDVYKWNAAARQRYLAKWFFPAFHKTKDWTLCRSTMYQS